MIVLRQRHRRPLALVDSIIFQRRAVVRFINAQQIVLYRLPEMPIMPVAPELAMRQRLRVVVIGGGRSQRRRQAIFADAAGREADLLILVEAPAGDHRQQLSLIPYRRAVVGRLPNDLQTGGIERRLRLQRTAAVGAEQRRNALFYRFAILLKRRGQQITQPAAAHRKA